MTEAEARAKIEYLTQWESEPALAEAEVDWLLVQAETTDDSGYEPDDPEYTDTYTEASVNEAISLGWQMKAAKVAGAYDVAAGGARADLSQQKDGLLRQARTYRAAGGVGSITLTTAIAEASS